VLLFRDSISKAMPETTNQWGGAGQTALPTSLSYRELLVAKLFRESISGFDD
jgi:hypothetical protein